MLWEFRIWQYQLCSHVQTFATLWTIAHQASLSMGFSRQEYWSGLPFPSSGDLPNPSIEPGSPALHLSQQGSPKETRAKGKSLDSRVGVHPLPQCMWGHWVIVTNWARPPGFQFSVPQPTACVTLGSNSLPALCPHLSFVKWRWIYSSSPPRALHPQHTVFYRRIKWLRIHTTVFFFIVV